MKELFEILLSLPKLLRFEREWDDHFKQNEAEYTAAVTAEVEGWKKMVQEQ